MQDNKVINKSGSSQTAKLHRLWTLTAVLPTAWQQFDSSANRRLASRVTLGTPCTYRWPIRPHASSLHTSCKTTRQRLAQLLVAYRMVEKAISLTDRVGHPGSNQRRSIKTEIEISQSVLCLNAQCHQNESRTHVSNENPYWNWKDWKDFQFMFNCVLLGLKKLS